MNWLIAHRVLPLLAVALLGAAATSRLGAQTVRYGVLGDSVREQLRRAWSDEPTQVERAYCVRRARIVARPVSPTAVDTVIRVLAVAPAPVRAADPNHVDFDCKPGTPELHTHTPATCMSDDPTWCVADGPGAYSCQPSREDYEKLVRRGDEFAIIQCDRKTFRFYYPSEYLLSSRAVDSGAAAKRPR
jgi:hypothetical protein